MTQSIQRPVSSSYSIYPHLPGIYSIKIFNYLGATRVLVCSVTLWLIGLIWLEEALISGKSVSQHICYRSQGGLRHVK